MDVFSKVKKTPQSKEQNHLETKLQGINLNLAQSSLSHQRGGCIVHHHSHQPCDHHHLKR